MYKKNFTGTWKISHPLETRRMSDNVELSKKVSMKFYQNNHFIHGMNISVLKPTDFNHRNVF